MTESYKFIEFIAPSLMTGATVVIGAYFGYFKKKFEIYGDINSKLEELDKLVTINTALENIKLDIDMARQNDILTLERIRAIGKGGVDFEYQKRANDSERLSEFSLKISELTKITITRSKNITIKAIALYDIISDGKPEIQYPSVLEHFDMDNMIKDLLSMEQIRMLFGLYFDNYGCTEFNARYHEWLKNIRKMGHIDSLFIQNIQRILSQSANKVEARKEFKIQMNNRTDINLNDEHQLFISFTTFVDSLKDITTIIRQEE